MVGAGLTVLGASNGVSALLVHYSILGGQALRYTLAALVLGVLLRLRRDGTRPSRRDLVCLGVLAATGLVGYNVTLIIALRHADPATVGSVVGTAPMLLAVIGPLVAGESPRPRVVACSLVVVCGASLVGGFGRADALGLLAATGTLLCEIAFSLLAVPLLPRLGALRIAAYETALAVPLLVLPALVIRPGRLLVAPTSTQLAALCYLALAMTVGSFVVWYSSMARLGADRAGLLLGGVPITVAASGLVLHTGEPTAWQYVGTVIIGLGVVGGLYRSAASPLDRVEVGRGAVIGPPLRGGVVEAVVVESRAVESRIVEGGVVEGAGAES